MVIVQNLEKKHIEGEIEYLYNYRLIKSDITINVTDRELKVQTYGIETERQDIKSGVITDISREAVTCISPYRHKVQGLLKLLYDNMVSPIHLIDILGEYIDEYVIDFDNEEAKMQSM